jgi:hypothetical protein
MSGVYGSAYPVVIGSNGNRVLDLPAEVGHQIMKWLLPLLAILFLAIGVSAQDRDFRRAEFFAGYSIGSASVNFLITLPPPPIFQQRTTHQGFNASSVVNLSRYFGIKGDVSGTYKSGRFVFKNVPTGFLSKPTTTYTTDGKSAIYNFLGGVQVKDNSKNGRVKPFAHAMIGAAHRSDQTPGQICIFICPSNTNETGFAAAFGGGVDVRLKGRIAVRLFQVDYNPVKFSEGTDNNFRFSTGLVF